METIRESVKEAWAAQFTVLQVLLYLLDFTNIPCTQNLLVIWQDIGYTLRIPI